jgi:hypothetical protein
VRTIRSSTSGRFVMHRMALGCAASMPTTVVLVVIAAFGSIAQPAAAQVYDAAADFSLAANPNSVWHYGFESSLGSPFTLFDTTATLFGPIDYWASSAVGSTPQINQNTSASTYHNTDPASDIEWAAGELSAHPGPAGQVSVVRFVAPADGVYQIDATFRGIDHTGTTTDVHVLVNNVSLFDQAVTGYHQPALFSTTLPLLQNQTVDFAVGYSNGSYLDDSTGLDAVITVVPEPAAAGALLAPAGLALLRRRRGAAREGPGDGNGRSDAEAAGGPRAGVPRGGARGAVGVVECGDDRGPRK